MLKNKKILIGVTGGIAVYKTAYLTRLLIKNGAEVKVIMTPAAKEFVAPLTFATLSKNPVYTEFFNPENGDWNSHVNLGLWADLFLIAPATANTIAKMANGIADNLLLTTYLSMKAPVIIAPAMDLDMYKHKTTQENIIKLTNNGVKSIYATNGELASGLIGEGRMEEPENILSTVIDFFNQKKKLKNREFLVTAGPTYEKIDPVRFIGNFSSGKMGFAIAEELANNGATVNLVSGPVNISTLNKNINLHKVTSAKEMFDKSIELFKNCDAAILAAAVADYTPTEFFEKKVKHSDQNLSIELKPTKDIAANLGKIKKQNQKLIGFALETNDEIKNAQKKLKSKNFDFIVLNSLNDKNTGFMFDTNKISIIDKNNNIKKFELKHKNQVAIDIVKELIKILN